MNRRKFFQLGVMGVIIAFVFVWKKLTSINTFFSHQDFQKLPFNKNKEVSFLNDFIVINKNNETQVFKAHCTHLGCTINKVENNVLVCPCHGSQFNLDGNPIKGPAYKPLERISAKISSDQKTIQITT